MAFYIANISTNVYSNVHVKQIWIRRYTGLLGIELLNGQLFYIWKECVIYWIIYNFTSDNFF